MEPTFKPDTKEDEAKTGWKSIASSVAILALAPIIAIFLTLFVFQSYEVFGTSMESTLKNGDRLIVQKLSKNWARLWGNEYIPQRYEIIVFERPKFVSNASNDVSHLIKRVIALPGERIVVSDGTVTVFNDEFPDGFIPDEGMEYAKDILTTSGNVDITVGAGEVFVMGDNRGNSQDSRRFGAIADNLITGAAKFRFLPIGDAQSL